MNKSQETTFKKFVIKYTVIGSALTWILATQLKELLNTIVDNIAEPLFSMDINQDGKPDIQQLNKMIYNCFGFKFPVGKIILGIIKTVLAIIIIYISIQCLYKYTDLLNI
jgi:large-conductance mechanosensitive channel